MEIDSAHSRNWNDSGSRWRNRDADVVAVLMFLSPLREKVGGWQAHDCSRQVSRHDSQWGQNGYTLQPFLLTNGGMTMRNPALDAVTASELVTSAVISCLVSHLVKIGTLRPEAVREIYESALLLIETSQGESPATADIFASARELIEQHLRPETGFRG